MANPAFVHGDTETTLLRKILDAFRSDAGLPDIPENSFRPGDDEAALLRKILHVIRQNAGNPDTAEFEFRPGDSEVKILRKILNNLDPLDEACLCGGTEYFFWRDILQEVSMDPSDPELSFRSGDSNYDILRKVLNNILLP